MGNNMKKMKNIRKFLMLLMSVVAISVNLPSFGMHIFEPIDKAIFNLSYLLGLDIFDAAKCGSQKRVEKILKYKKFDKSFNINSYDEHGYTVLYWACYNNNLELVKFLLLNGAKESINKVCVYKKTVLYLACEKNNIEMVELLLDNGAKESVNITDSFFYTPLILACYKNNLKMAKVLLEFGANVCKGSMNKVLKNIQDSKTSFISKQILEALNLTLKFDKEFKKAKDKSAFIKSIKVGSVNSEFNFKLNRAKNKFNYKPVTIIDAHDSSGKLKNRSFSDVRIKFSE